MAKMPDTEPQNASPNSPTKHKYDTAKHVLYLDARWPIPLALEKAIPDDAFVSKERPPDSLFRHAKQLARERKWSDVRP